MFERCLYFNVNALARSVNRIWDQAFNEFGLSPAHAYLLRLVLAQPGISQKAIAKELKLEKSTITRFIDSLEDKGLLRRSKAGTEDSREQRIVATARAKRIHADLEKKGDELYYALCKKLGKHEIQKLVAQLRETTKLLG